MKARRALVRETKNGKQRTLPVAGKALDAQRELRLQGLARREHVFTNPSGHPGDSSTSTAIGTQRSTRQGSTTFTFTTFVTRRLLLAAQGASLLEIADVLGHKILAMVKRYSHLVVDHNAKVIERLVAAKGL